MTRERDRIQENANGYVVCNCPAFNLQAYEHCCSLDGNYKCEGCTDCVIKQVIEKCNKYKSIYPVISSVYIFINEILDVFDIEEINK